MMRKKLPPPIVICNPLWSWCQDLMIVSWHPWPKPLSYLRLIEKCGHKLFSDIINQNKAKRHRDSRSVFIGITFLGRLYNMGSFDPSHSFFLHLPLFYLEKGEQLLVSLMELVSLHWFWFPTKSTKVDSSRGHCACQSIWFKIMSPIWTRAGSNSSSHTWLAKRRLAKTLKP